MPSPSKEEKEAQATHTALLQASTPPPSSLFSTLITANHILHHNAIVDAYGHISVRNPQNPSTFFLSRSLAPALVSNREDLEEYHIEDARPVHPERQGMKKGYAERFIHSEVYKKYSGVRSVVHSHSEAVIPFGISSVPLKPVFHMGGVMGHQVPVYDIASHYTTSDPLHSLLVTNQHLGAALAAGFNPLTSLAKGLSTIKNLLISSSTPDVDFPPHPTLLMRGHGMTVLGTSIEEAVYRSVYTCTNARVQTTALLMQGGYNLSHIAERLGRGGGEKGENPGPAKQEGIHFLGERECRDAWTQMRGTAERPWELWCREVEGCGLYVNDLRGDSSAT